MASSPRMGDGVASGTDDEADDDAYAGAGVDDTTTNGFAVVDEDE